MGKDSQVPESVIEDLFLQILSKQNDRSQILQSLPCAKVFLKLNRLLHGHSEFSRGAFENPSKTEDVS